MRKSATPQQVNINTTSVVTQNFSDLFPVSLLVLLVAHSEVHQSVSNADNSNGGRTDNRRAERWFENSLLISRKGKGNCIRVNNISAYFENNEQKQKIGRTRKCGLPTRHRHRFDRTPFSLIPPPSAPRLFSKQKQQWKMVTDVRLNQPRKVPKRNSNH